MERIHIEHNVLPAACEELGPRTFRTGASDESGTAQRYATAGGETIDLKEGLGTVTRGQDRQVPDASDFGPPPEARRLSHAMGALDSSIGQWKSCEAVSARVTHSGRTVAALMETTFSWFCNWPAMN